MKYFLILFTFLFTLNVFAAPGTGTIQADNIKPSVSGNAVNIPNLQVDNVNLDASTVKSISGDLILDAASELKPNKDVVPNTATLNLGSIASPWKDVYTSGESFGLKIENVTSGTIPSSSATKKGRLVYTTDTKKLYVDDGTAFIEAGGSGGGISEWLTAVTYAVNDIIHTNNKIYKCLTAHVAGTFSTDLAASKWIELGNDPSSEILTGFSSAAGTISGTDSVLQAIQKLNGNDALDKTVSTKAQDGAAVSTSQIQTPYNQLTTTAAGERLIETGNANVLADPGTEAVTSPWSAYKDAAGVLPVDGTAGTALYITCANSATSPLAGTKSFLITKTANNAQGEGCSIPFTIPTSSTYKVNRLAFDYAIASGTYTDDQVEWFVYDVTNGTVKPFTPSKLKNHSLPSETFAPNGEFQASGSTSYRLIAHIAGTSASAYSLKFDNFKLGVFEKTYGSVVTDWVAYTPTFTGFGTVSNVNAQWRKSGDSVELSVRFQSGTSTATEARVTLPTGFVADSSKILTLQQSGIYSRSTSSTAKGGMVLMEPSVGYVTFGDFNTIGSGTTSSLAKALGTAVENNSSVVSFSAKIPIAGWSSSQVMSNDADTRVVAAIITGNPASTSANGVVIFPTVSKDTHGKYNPTTGEYTVPETGYYKVSSALYGSFSYGAFLAAVNGSGKQPALGFNTASGTVSGSTTVFANAGEKITVYNTVALSSLSSYCGLTIERISGPSRIAASESVSFSANTSTTAATTSAPFIYTVKDHDTHNAYSTVTGVFTVPSPGKYHCDAFAYSVTDYTPYIYKNGVSVVAGTRTNSGQQAGYVFFTGSLLTGNTIEVRPGASVTASAGAVNNQFSCFRMGNY